MMDPQFHFPTVRHPRLFRPRWHKPSRKMPERFDALALYNAEVQRGLTHRESWKAKMAALQAEYDAWSAEHGWNEWGEDAKKLAGEYEAWI